MQKDFAFQQLARFKDGQEIVDLVHPDSISMRDGEHISCRTLA